MMCTSIEQEKAYHVQLGEKLVALRHMHGMTQGQMAQHINVAPQQLQKYEKGTNRISVFKLHTILRSLNVDFNEFYCMETLDSIKIPLEVFAVDNERKRRRLSKKLRRYIIFCQHADGILVRAVNTIIYHLVKQEIKKHDL